MIGTAGHIDHGKSALVRALTGIDPDRLEEEKRRGISIDLGFAHLALAPDVQASFIDVPGHERFVKNMLAGVGGIDLVMLVVAADESIKPQTREHFDICRLLGITRGLTVITKADLVDAEILELVQLEVDEFTAGSFLEGAPRLAVSAKTGRGIEELKKTLLGFARQLPKRRTTHAPRLPVDRSFAVKGFGTVVTGTLLTGTIKAEQELEIYPSGKLARVRGVQVHGKAAQQAVAGQRTAVNLAGVEHGDLHRGMVLSLPGLYAPTKVLDCSISLLPSAKALKHRAPVHFHAGTAEIEAEVRMASRTALQPGESGYARIVLREPALLLPGDRFILRKFSPVVTIAGGVVLDAAPPRRAHPDRWAVLAGDALAPKLALYLKESRWGLSFQQLAGRTGVPLGEVQQVLKPAGAVVLDEQRWALDGGAWQGLQESIRKLLAAYHKQNPLQPGLSKEEVRSRELPGAPPFLLEALLKASPGVVGEGELLRLATHKLHLKTDEEDALRKIEGAFASAGLSVPSAAEVLKNSGIDANRARTLLQILLREKRLVKVAEDLLFHPSALTPLRQLLTERKGQRFGVTEFKDWTGVSRKYAIPLLEYFDRERVTRREGDARVIL
ncbi:MAG: selenocysteine-specific translation elongation factor [Bryobacterales bacterium]|nr:selenocysteine-specific translation elongation factor [Bryobacterales bacterium]